MAVFGQFSYKRVLHDRLLALKAQNPKLTFQALAAHCRVQKTYLSRVLNDKKAHLSSDQLHLAIEYLGFSSEETEYLETLFEWERSTLKSRREKLSARLKRLEQAALRTERHIGSEVPALGPEGWTDYYLDPVLQLVHMFLCIGRYAKDPSSIEGAIGLSRSELSGALKKLCQLGIATTEGGAYRVVRENLHLPADSALHRPYQTLLRLMAMERTRRMKAEDLYTYSVIVSATSKERDWIRREFMALLEKADLLIRKAPSEEVFQLHFDLFPWKA
jgi:hypothetical protein